MVPQLALAHPGSKLRDDIFFFIVIFTLLWLVWSILLLFTLLEIDASILLHLLILELQTLWIFFRCLAFILRGPSVAVVVVLAPVAVAVVI